jgi:acetyl-CoA carboxylase carboxyltransferase component
MKAWKSNVNPESDEYKENLSSMLALVEELNKKLKDAQFEGRDSVRKRHESQGKLLARSRIEMLIDQDSPFLELLPLAGCDKPDSPPTSICGIGLVKYVPTNACLFLVFFQSMSLVAKTFFCLCGPT